MKARQAVLVVLTAAVTLTSVAAASSCYESATRSRCDESDPAHGA